MIVQVGRLGLQLIYVPEGLIQLELLVVDL